MLKVDIDLATGCSFPVSVVPLQVKEKKENICKQLWEIGCMWMMLTWENMLEKTERDTKTTVKCNPEWTQYLLYRTRQQNQHTSRLWRLNNHGHPSHHKSYIQVYRQLFQLHTPELNAKTLWSTFRHSVYLNVQMQSTRSVKQKN